jgi:hypothetical protein
MKTTLLMNTWTIPVLDFHKKSGRFKVHFSIERRELKSIPCSNSEKKAKFLLVFHSAAVIRSNPVARFTCGIPYALPESI